MVLREPSIVRYFLDFFFCGAENIVFPTWACVPQEVVYG